MATIQLLLEDRQNRRLLADALGDEHDVVADASSADAFLEADVDLCIVDGAAFRGHRETLAEKKDRAAPVFLPYLLLLGERDPDRATESVWERVDEVIDAPIDRAELGNRVLNLLRRRDLSLELKRRQEFTEERFRTLFESTPDPIVVVTDEGVVTEVNDAFTRMFDVSREAVVDAPVTAVDASPTESVERLLLRVDGSADRADDDSGTVEIGAESGDTHVTELNVDVVEELGDATERIGIFRDVTGREEYRRKLERQVEQLEQFASVISHDLRDPLNVAMAKTRLARQECDSERLVELTEVHERMATLIEDVLTLAKQGKTVGKTEPVSLESVVETAWSTVETTGEATLSPGPDLPTVEADEERLRTLLENLFRNAVAHAGPDVTISVSALEDGRGFAVADDGSGIPDAERDDVFEYGHTTSADGTGLGLAIVRQIAEAHGWTVTLADADVDADGARFEFRGMSLA